MSLGLNVGLVDENVASTVPNYIRSSSFLNVENVHLEFNSVTLSNVVNVSHVAIIKTQVVV
jgi:hypothetical protein